MNSAAATKTPRGFALPTVREIPPSPAPADGEGW
jgi:hypothetical protein